MRHSGTIHTVWPACTEFAGHVHQQGSHRDSSGIYHYTLPAMLETPRTELTCHGIVHVGSEGLVIEGSGALRSERVARFDATASAASEASDATAH
jgi:hypothetical protein